MTPAAVSYELQNTWHGMGAVGHFVFVIVVVAVAVVAILSLRR